MLQNKKILLTLFLTGCALLEGCRPGSPAVNNSRQNSTPPIVVSNKNAGINNDMTNKDLVSHLPSGFEMPTDDVGRKLLKEYGAVFVAQGGAVPPKTVIFKNEAEVSAWQAGVSVSKENIGGVEIELQKAAMTALKEAASEAAKENQTITPRGNDAARRSYRETEELWASRVDPGLKHWVEAGKISEREAARIRALSPFDQVSEILRLEEQGLYFSKDLSKSIIYSVAPPGTSQHLSMLALDVVESENAKVRAILAKHGWFQTVSSDLPHFTFLGANEAQLPSLGLKRSVSGSRVFWTPAD